MPADRIVYARLATDTPVHEPGGFRALLNSFLPRKRAISQLLVRDPDDRVLLCQLTYKQDWDLPGGVVEVGESPQRAVGREVEEELGLDAGAGPDADHRLAAAVGRLGRRALPGLRRRRATTPRCSTGWSGSPARSAAWSSAPPSRSRSAAPTSRRAAWRAAVAALDGSAPAYVESGQST